MTQNNLPEWIVRPPEIANNINLMCTTVRLDMSIN
jgi:hypothetical protein